jgi:glycosyltransferase involved in cell wall biosynthesis
MPSKALKPIGGFKVVYEYANRLVNDGYKVTIVYSSFTHWNEQSLKRKIRWIVRYFYYLFNSMKWFQLDKRVEEKLVLNLAECLIPNADIYIATGAETAEYLQNYKREGKKFYLIQGYENWDISDERLIATYHAPLKKIVISKWLLEIMTKCNESAIYIPNGFDFKCFNKNIDFEDKDRFLVTMLYHTNAKKGSEDGLKALGIVKNKYPDLKVNLFGIWPRPSSLPDWCSYYRKPDKETLNRIYNEAAIFIGTSHSEGWGLTIGEAMICGAAVACTDINGYREMCNHEKTALLSPPKDYKALATNIIRLIEDDELRIKIAKAGYDNIRQFTWDKSYKKLRILIEN